MNSYDTARRSKSKTVKYWPASRLNCASPGKIFGGQWADSLPRSRFLDVTQRFPKSSFGGTLRDIQQTAAWEPNGLRRSDFFSLDGGSAAKIIFPEFARVSLHAG